MASRRSTTSTRLSRWPSSPNGTCDYLSPELIPRYSLYLSFTGGPTLRRIEREYGSPMARALYCSVDPELYFPERKRLTSGSSAISAPTATIASRRSNAFLTQAGRAVAERATSLSPGRMYPDAIRWPENVERIAHLEPKFHRAFYNAQRFTLNVTRADMIRAGYSPSVRLFEAAACGTPIISDAWAGLSELFTPGRRNPDRAHDRRCAGDPARACRRVSGAPSERVRASACSAEHTAAHRAAELETYIEESPLPEGGTSTVA